MANHVADGTGAFNMTLLDFLNIGREEGKAPVTAQEMTTRGGRMGLDDVLTTVSGKPITVGDVLVYLKATGAFRNAIYQMISIEVMEMRAREAGIRITEQEIHSYSKAKREGMELTDAVAMNDYCKWLGITFDHWQKEVEIELLRQRLKQALFPDKKTREIYNARHQELVTVTLSRLVCRERAQIEALHGQIKAGASDFSTLAREHSLERNTRIAGGYLGRMRRGMLPDDIERALFAARPNEIVGPVSQDGYWVLYCVEDIQGSEYTEELKEQIAERLFADWLEREVRNVPA